MTTKTRQKNRRFCIFDYFLDGVFLKWSEVISLEDGTQIRGKIMGTETISENERRIFLRSC